MIQPDARYYAYERGEDVCGVESAAHSSFRNDKIHASALEPLHGQGGHAFEKRRHAAPVPLHLQRRQLHLLQKRVEFLVAYIFAIDAETLVEAHEMRRGV